MVDLFWYVIFDCLAIKMCFHSTHILLLCAWLTSRLEIYIIFYHLFQGLVFRKNSHQLFSASHDRLVKIWNLDEMAYVETL